MNIWDWHRDAGIALLVLIIGCIIAVNMPDCSATAASDEDKKWKDWEKQAGQAGAGVSVPPPDDVMTPHESWCENIKGWCPTVKNGVMAGRNWCHGKGKKRPKCYYTHRYKSYDIYLEWKDWLDEFDSGRHGLIKAGTIRTESYVGEHAENPMFSYTPSQTKECGLASIDLNKARQWDINACDARANIWLAQYLSALRVFKLREKYPQLEKAPLVDQWRLAGAGGAIGAGKIYNLIEASGAARTKEDGSLFYAHPHDRVLKWLMWRDSTDPFFFYNFMAISFLTRNVGRGAFRVARAEGAHVLFGDMFVHGLEWAYGEPVLPSRPDDIMAYPGDGQHCRCYLWKDELENKRPAPHLMDPDLVDPRTLD